MRRAPERGRVRLSKFFRWVLGGIYRARRRVSGPGRRTVQFCWAIRRPSTRTMRTRIAACSPKDAVAVPSLAATPACLSTWAGGLLFGADGVPVAAFVHRTSGNASPVPRDSPRSPRQSRLRSRTLLRPVVLRDFSEGLAKPPPCRVLDVPANRLCGRLAHPSIRPCRL